MEDNNGPSKLPCATEDKILCSSEKELLILTTNLLLPRYHLKNLNVKTVGAYKAIPDVIRFCRTHARRQGKR